MAEQELWESAAMVLARKAQTERVPSLSRDRGVVIVAEAMNRQRRRRMGFKGLVLGVPAIAAAAAAAIWMRNSIDTRAPASDVAVVSPSNCPREAGCPNAIDPAVEIATTNAERVNPGGKMTTDSGDPREFVLASGSRLRIAGGSVVDYVEGNSVHRFSMSKGNVEFSVVRQRASERFLVDTPDVEIEVHGTAFDVAINDRTDSCGHRTAVSVSEGIVEVRAAGQRSFVNAGSHWPEKNCDSVPPSTQQQHPSQQHPTSSVVRAQERAGNAEPAQPISQRAPLQTSVPPKSDATASASSLAKQNELFARATLALEHREYERAIALYDELDAKYPNGPLAASAAAARQRCRELASKAR